MLKTFILLLTTILIFLNNSFCQESQSGIKLSFDTQLLNLLKKIDINSKITNMTLINQEGITYEKKTFPSVYMKLLNLTVNNFKNPKSEDIIINNDKQNKIVEIKIKNFEVELKATYDLKIASFLKDQGKNSLIKIEVNELLLAFQFTNERILITNFDFKLKNVEFKFNQFILNILKKIFKGLIIKQINKSVYTFKNELEESLNKMIYNKYLIDLGGMGIGINSTITESLNMDVYQIIDNKEYISLNSKGISLENIDMDRMTKKFLNSPEKIINIENVTIPNDELKSFLSLGIRGEIFATIMKDLKPKISEPVEMKFNQRLNKNGVRLLLSDYSINTILFFGQQSGAINARITNDTNSYFPFNSDIEGLKKFFPKLTEIYKENYPVEIKINCDVNSRQPTITTHSDGSKLSFNLAFELKVVNSTDIFDEPVSEMLLNFDGNLQFQYMFDENEIFHIVIFRSNIESVNILKDNISENEEVLKRNLAGIIDFIVDSFKPSISNIKVGEMFRNATGYGIENIEFDTRNEYMELAFDLKDN
jgi:hypothetical protein